MGGTGGGVNGWYRWWGGWVVQVVGWMGGTGGGVNGWYRWWGEWVVQVVGWMGGTGGGVDGWYRWWGGMDFFVHLCSVHLHTLDQRSPRTASCSSRSAVALSLELSSTTTTMCVSELTCCCCFSRSSWKNCVAQNKAKKSSLRNYPQYL